MELLNKKKKDAITAGIKLWSLFEENHHLPETSRGEKNILALRYDRKVKVCLTQ